MKKILVLVGSFALLSASQLSVAQANDGSSGCGLGWEVSQKQSLLSSSIRTTTNTFLPNTFSMTSGTSGCAKHSIVKNDEKAVQYAVSNHDSLIVEMAEGRGEFLAGFAQALGCDAASYSAFSSFAQSHYDSLVDSSANDGIGLYRAVRTGLQADPRLAGACVPRV
jgi:hypothetical protein